MKSKTIPLQSPPDDTLEDLRASIQRFMRTSRHPDTTYRYYNELIANLYSVLSKIHAMEDAGFSREAVVAELTEVRELHSRSPFIARCQQWPNGYQGDYETIEYLVSQKNLSPIGTTQYWLEEYALGSVISQQHRNKISAQAAEILGQAIIGMQQGKTQRILIVACGGCSDIYRIRHILATMPISIVLNDIDEAAIKYSLERLTPTLGDKIEVVHGNILLKLKGLAKRGPFDLVLTGGLYDYLTDTQAAKLTRFSIEHLLSKDGVFLFTNLGVGNPLRAWIEYVADWHMHYRTEEIIDEILISQGIEKEKIFHARDASRLTIITKVLKNPLLKHEQVFI
jgi:extracellular factor (EF) 3-hydroxypalmitic acid methyl ester biosynthesis protein